MVFTIIGICEMSKEVKAPQFGMCYKGVFHIQPQGVSKYICIAVYNVMCCWAYGEGKNSKIFRLSQKRIVELLGCCRPVVLKAIRELRNHGYVRLVGKYKIGAMGTQYEIIPRMYSEDMSKPDEHMLKHKPGLPKEETTLLSSVNEVDHTRATVAGEQEYKCPGKSIPTGLQMERSGSI
jgi:hypothetical protein